MAKFIFLAVYLLVQTGFSATTHQACIDFLKSQTFAATKNLARSEQIYADLQNLLKKRSLKIVNSESSTKEEILTFLKKSRQEAGLDLNNLPLSIDSDLESVAQSYEHNFGRLVVIKNNENEVVGTAGVIRSGPNSAELRKIYLGPEVRGGGIGKLLVQYLIEFAQDSGYNELSLNTHPQLQQAISLYTSLGFTKSADTIPDRPSVMIFKKSIEQKTLGQRLLSRQAKVKFFSSVKDLLLKKRAEIKSVLLEVETERGAEYELRQVEDLLLNVDVLEMNNLQRIKGVKNVAVYGSTNIPLYTLMMHAMIPATVAENVWFRTPSATRQIYTKLFNILAMDESPGSFQGIHILSEAKDVQYDNFQKRHVLGLNNKGKKSLRPISEVVLFTGSPETGREILRSNIRELAKMESKNEKQVFLAFGAGINPLVITKDAQKNMEASINAAMDSVMINSGQDCIAPNLVFVDESIADQYLAQLKDRVSHVKVDAEKRAENLITPLYFSESLDGLVDYKEHFKSFLANPDTAIIDRATRSVTPHLFVFSPSEFSRVPIKEHFAPFLVIFKYKNRDELKKMIEDPRVQNKVMYASIFGASYATPEVSRTVQMFQETRHTVSVNFSIYADESGNMPFGGLGPDSSTANLLEKSGDSIKLETAQKPLLFSEDAARFFSQSDSPAASIETQGKAKSFMKDLLKNSNQVLDSLPFHLQPWADVVSPQLVNRPTGLKYLRERIQATRIWRVYRYDGVLSEKERQNLEAFYGLPLLFPQADQTLVKVPGVVLHNGLPAEIPKLLNKFRGDVNPYLGRGLLAGLLKNKLSEYYLAEAIKPGSMAATESFETLMKNGVLGTDFERMRQAVRTQIASVMESKGTISPTETEQIRTSLEQLIQRIFVDVRSHYPQGAFFKNFGELATADLGIMITTFATNPIHLAQQFVMRLNQILKDRKTAESLLNTFSVEPFETGSKFIAQILENPKSVMVQVREELTKTEQGQNMEFRVSFIDGEPFNTKLRFSREFYPHEAQKAEQFVRDFFAKAPPEIKHLSGGADVVFTRDGRMLFMEFNFGGSDGTLFPTFFIMDNHEATSNLLAHPTPFYQKMLDLAKGPTAKVITFFKALHFHLEPWNKTSLDSLSAVEFGRWYRDFKLREWQLHPSEESAEKVFAEIKHVLTSRGEVGEDLQKIIEGAKEFLVREGFHLQD